MEHFICRACGTQFAATQGAPECCPICDDPRQYIPPDGQQWTTLTTLQRTHTAVIRPIEPDLTGIGVQPDFAIGQRAMLIHTFEGNVLWDCVSVIDDPAVCAVRALGGIQAIAISHPHYYSAMVEWSREFEAPIYLHEAERPWVMRLDSGITFWAGETLALFGGITLIRCGGHFEGGQVLHWPDGAEGRGVLCTGDIITVVPDARFVSFMYSYPNLIPLPASTVERIAAAVRPYAFDRIYGAWWPRIIPTDAYAAVQRSAQRYVQALNGLFEP